MNYSSDNYFVHNTLFLAAGRICTAAVTAIHIICTSAVTVLHMYSSSDSTSYPP